MQDAAARLRARGHAVLVVDQYDGRSFDDYATAIASQERVGFPALWSHVHDFLQRAPRAADVRMST